MNSFDVTQELPLTEPTFLILLSLAGEPLHGYAILQSVRALSGERVSLSTGTLYGGLKRLLDRRLIERIDQEDPAEVGRPRKFYALTTRGRRLVEAETRRLEALAAVAQRRLAAGEPARP